METGKLIDYVIRILVVPCMMWGVWATQMIFAIKQKQAVGDESKSNLLDKITEVIAKLDKIDERLKDLEIQRK